MDYSLALELKEAGFLQKAMGMGGNYLREGWKTILCNCDICENEGQTVAYANELVPKDAAYLPTLSELIEACGDGEHEFTLRWRPDTQWSAIQEGKTLGFGSFEMGIEIYDCSTPKEAVSRLWLALNKK